MYSEEERKNNAEEPDWLKSEKEQFSKYRDKNKDGFLGKVNVEKFLVIFGPRKQPIYPGHFISNRLFTFTVSLFLRGIYVFPLCPVA
jgi:hypothetical protein